MKNYLKNRSLSEDQNHQKYDICLILTDGAITDLNRTIDTIVELSDFPVSIVIIGVGQADFSMMRSLDADESPLYSEKWRKYSSRDIVQFVQFNQFNNDPVRLAKEVLREIPNQMIRYFQGKGIHPNYDPTGMMKTAALTNAMGKTRSDMDADTKETFLRMAASSGFDKNIVDNFVESYGLPDNQLKTLQAAFQAQTGGGYVNTLA